MSSFSKDAIERTVRTVIQAVVAAVLAVIVGSGGWDAIDWAVVWKVGAFAGVIALLTSLVAKGVASPSDASFVKTDG